MRLAGSDRFGKVYSRPLDSTLWARALHRLHRVAGDKLPDAVTKLGLPLADPATTQKKVSDWFSSSMLEDANKRKALLEKGTWAEVQKSKDPLVKVMLSLYPLWRAEEERQEAMAGKMLMLRPHYLAAVSAVSDTPVAPDANSTLRVTYGTVRGYKKTPDAESYFPFTGLSAMKAKATGEPPFHAPANLLAAVDEGRGVKEATIPMLEDVPVNFLADLDITGGNSGSAALNGNGEIIGLAFDGNMRPWRLIGCSCLTSRVRFRSTGATFAG